MGRKIALVIGNSQYDDQGLAGLCTADVDVRELAGVLKSPEMGQFETVTEVANQSVAVVRRSIAHFFSESKRDDLLLLYFSGHGVRDEQGHLYLAVKDTERPLLAGTSIEAAFITAQMDRSHSKRQILILDCCHSGAFAHGVKGADTGVMGVGPAFEGNGYGRVVLTATDATQYAWEGNQIIGESDKSVFTHYLLEGLRTGEADRDRDGLITIDELYDYVYEHVVSETPKQTPGKWTYRMHGEIVVARNPHPPVKAAGLPQELQALIDSPFVRLRSEAIPELAGLLFGRHQGLMLAARAALERLSADDSRSVAAAAEEVLSKIGSESAAIEIAAKQHERRATEAIERARGDFAAGRHESAVAALERFQPSHTIVSSVLGELRADIERRRLEAERQRLALVRAAREKEIAAGLDAARLQVERGQFDEAARAVRRLHAIDPEATGVVKLAEIIEAGRLAAEEAERRRQDAQARLDAASKQFRRRDFVKSLALVEEALRADPKNVDAITLRADIQRALAEQPAPPVTSQPGSEVRSAPQRTHRTWTARALGLAGAMVAASLALYIALMPQLNKPADTPTPAPVERQVAAPAAPPSPVEEPPKQPATTPEPVSARTPAIVPAVVPPVETRKPIAAPPPKRPDRGSAAVEPKAPVAAPSAPLASAPAIDVNPQAARLLEQGDKLLDQRNYDGAAAAYDEAAALGSAAGKERGGRARQQKIAEVRLRLTRAEKLLDTGEYDAALRALDEATAIDPKNGAIPGLKQRAAEAQAFERGLRPKKNE